MKIKRMTATFGCLENQTLELKEGLNILDLPNESGKSTWCAFLRVMLYGLNTRERDKKGFLADKTRYLPWSGHAMEGELLCTWQGKDLLIRRYTKGSTPMGAFEATYVDSGAAVPGLTGDNVGDVLIGVSRSVFERSAFLGQSALAVTHTPELEKRLSALVSSGEEGVAATQVKSTLTDWQRKRQFRTRGAIPTLEERREELTKLLDSIHDMTTQVCRSQTEVDKLEELRARLKHQVDLHHAHQDSAQARAYGQARQELDQAEGQLARLKSQLPQSGALPEKAALEKARDDVAYLRTLDSNLKLAAKEIEPAQAAVEAAKAATEDPVFTGAAAEARAKASEAEKQLSELETTGKIAGRNRWLMPLLGVLLSGGVLAGICTLQGDFTSVYLSALVFLVLGVILGITGNSRAKKCARERKAILEQFRVDEKEALVSAAEDYCQRLAALEKAEDELKRVKKAESELRQQREDAWNGLHDFVAGFAPEVKDVFGFSAAVTRSLTLIDAIAAAEQGVESAQKLFDTVAQRGKGCAGALLEQPTITLEQAQAGVKEAERRIAAHQNDLSMALGRRSTLGEPETVQAQLERIDEMLAVCHTDYDALAIALEAMDQADAEMRSRFSPELNRRAGEYLSRLTGGKYAKIRLNREMEAGAEETGSVATRDVLSLSQGTADQLWLAVRLAVCDLALPEEDRCPLVLDDALVNFDDGRTVPALELLHDLSRRRQILLFTCHDREERLYRQYVVEGKVFA